MPETKELEKIFPIHIAKAIIGGELTEDDKEIIEKICSIDWKNSALCLENPKDAETAAEAVALGAVMAYGFGNFNAIASHPHQETVKYVNITKGRPENQTGSVTTTKENIFLLFDWDKLPKELDKEKMAGLINSLYEIGPFGFRGPAAFHMPEHLTSVQDGIKTVQLIAPGYKCPSNILIAKILEKIGSDFLYITSANFSHNSTGNKEEPAHYKMSGIQKDFGGKLGYFMVAHKNEDANRLAYPKHEPMSTSIIAFHKISYDGNNRPALVLERHGSMHFDDIAKIVKRYGLNLVKSEKAGERLPIRQY